MYAANDTQRTVSKAFYPQTGSSNVNRNPI